VSLPPPPPPPLYPQWPPAPPKQRRFVWWEALIGLVAPAIGGLLLCEAVALVALFTAVTAMG
jgi:hypothetical protein